MRNADVFEAIGPASIGGEYPKCLETVIAVEWASALCAFFSADFAEDAAIDCRSHNLIVVAGGDRSADTVNHIAAHLHGGQPAVHVALSWTDRGCLRVDDAHETSDGAQICGHRDGLMREDQCVKLEGGACWGADGCRGHFDDVTENPTPFFYPHPWRDGNLLHNPGGNHLAFSGFRGREGCVQANRQYGSAWKGRVALRGSLVIGCGGVAQRGRCGNIGIRAVLWTLWLRIRVLRKECCAQQHAEEQA